MMTCVKDDNGAQVDGYQYVANQPRNHEAVDLVALPSKRTNLDFLGCSETRSLHATSLLGVGCGAERHLLPSI